MRKLVFPVRYEHDGKNWLTSDGWFWFASKLATAHEKRIQIIKSRKKTIGKS